MTWLLLFGGDDGHDEIGNDDAGACEEKSKHEQQTHNSWVEIEVICQTCAYTRDHAVGLAAGKGFVVAHFVLLSFVYLFYAEERKELQVTCAFYPQNNLRLLHKAGIRPA